LLADPWFDRLFALLDREPPLALLLNRIKGTSPVAARKALNSMMLARAWGTTQHRFGSALQAFSHAAMLIYAGMWFPNDFIFMDGRFTKEQKRSNLRRLRDLGWGDGVLTPQQRQWLAQVHSPEGSAQVSKDRFPGEMLRLVGIFEGLTTPRRFRSAFSPRQAMVLLRRWTLKRLDPGIFESFRRFMGDWPVGTVVINQERKVEILGLPSLHGGQTAYPLSQLTREEGVPQASGMPWEENRFLREALHVSQLPLPEELKTLRLDWMKLPRTLSAPQDPLEGP
jgi:hypothetical protein